MDKAGTGERRNRDVHVVERVVQLAGQLVRRQGRVIEQDHERACSSASGVSAGGIKVPGVERGERNLTLKSVERLAERAQVDPMALLADDDAR